MKLSDYREEIWEDDGFSWQTVGGSGVYLSRYDKAGRLTYDGQPWQLGSMPQQLTQEQMEKATSV